jgi:hypothetical protein
MKAIGAVLPINLFRNAGSVARVLGLDGMGVNVKRRTFFGMIGGAAVWPLATSAQQRKVWRVGFVSGNARPEVIESSIVGGFPQGMRELGYIEGRDFVIEWRFAEAKTERYDAIADELAKLDIDIFVVGAPQAVDPPTESGSRNTHCPRHFHRPCRAWLRSKSFASRRHDHRPG